MPIKGGYLLAAGGGAVLLWSGLRGKSWSTALRDVISGQSPTTIKTTAYPITTSSQAFSTSSGGGSSVAATGTGAVGGTVAKNKAIARTLTAVYGWATGDEWAALDSLWTRESGWNNKAKNPTSGAYGIPQSLPASKMGALANPPVSSASAQIAWGLKYIKQVYGDPVAAEAHENSQGWY